MFILCIHPLPGCHDKMVTSLCLLYFILPRVLRFHALSRYTRTQNSVYGFNSLVADISCVFCSVSCRFHLPLPSAPGPWVTSSMIFRFVHVHVLVHSRTCRSSCEAACSIAYYSSLACLARSRSTMLPAIHNATQYIYIHRCWLHRTGTRAHVHSCPTPIVMVGGFPGRRMVEP